MSRHLAPQDTPLPAGPELDRARSLTLRYVIASTLILGVAGILGVMLRDSQAGLARLPNGWYYALMTAHGLGAFVGWAAFGVMGLSYWVLAQIGFPLSRRGVWLAKATWWLMVIGVLGVVVTCLGFKFGASWVFLYPLSFHSAGQWGRWTAFFFHFSVLIVGVSILTWCFSILDTVVGPALHARRRNVFNRIGCALGFGYLAPKRFATDEKPVPYAVIPLTVIALDMIIATIPLAILLVEMMIQSLAPSVHVDPLLAKNVLWFFGHPVVYLLLFPAVAVAYVLVPRMAGRPLVAGNVITIGWAIAVVTNVIIWAHHIYIDYPAGSPQAAINTAMQPLTFSVTIVSALSLYSLFFTIFRSNYKWNAVGTALFLALVSWLIAGLSGVINATIYFDQIVHNTLWVVGHFHQMALLNIGFVLIGGDLRLAARPRPKAALQRRDGPLASLADLLARHDQLRPLALAGTARRPQALCDPAAPLRPGYPGGDPARARARSDADPLRLEHRPDDSRQGCEPRDRPLARVLPAQPPGDPGRAHRRRRGDRGDRRRDRHPRAESGSRGGDDTDHHADQLGEPRRGQPGGREADLHERRLHRLPHARGGGSDRHGRPESRSEEAGAGPGAEPRHEREGRHAGLQEPTERPADQGRRRLRGLVRGTG